ncbi:MAG: exodeoxyribonuclease VII large subunit [Ruminococcaceae bacterium]|nr:exodeoxyribonuclease VII large subunit [Oscillospiraceae bacterium]
MDASTVLTVWQVNNYAKAILSEDMLLSDITVTGELSGIKRHSSGHMYFTLKDDRCSISAAMFKWQRQTLRFVPEDGMQVVVRGKVTLYEQTGQYQIVVSSMQPSGIGELYAALERLKAKLESEGLFDPARKRPLPEFPQRIGVVTSPTGAAVRDIINVLGRRYPLAEVVLCPVQVQGDEAPAQIAAAVNRLSSGRLCDVMIVGRGGGSIEDLWAFNDEGVARAVAASSVPVISAVGHETDFTICDFAADLRAPTPSAAAELAVPDMYALQERIDYLGEQLRAKMEARLDRDELRLNIISARPCFTSPTYGIEQQAQRVDMALSRIEGAFARQLAEQEKRLSVCAGQMAALNPFAVLSRGYCVAYQDEKPVSHAASLSSGDEISLQFSDGRANCRVI